MAYRSQAGGLNSQLKTIAAVPRVAVICDLAEENWPSMDLVAEMIYSRLQANHSSQLRVSRLCPQMQRRFTRLPVIGRQWSANNADRLLNRYWDYPRWLRRHRDEFDLFHLVDHSYGQLLHELPPERTVVTCHDLDTFRCLLEPESEPRPLWFRRMMQRTLDGFRRAARVICVSETTRQHLLAHGLFEADKLTVVTNGVHPSCRPEGNVMADAKAAQLLGKTADGSFLLHVGSTIPRKRIEALLQIFAAVRQSIPQTRLVRVGGPFTAEQNRLLHKLKLQDSVLVLPFLDRDVLAAVYRRSALVLQPSEREGFGLPVAEAMACGTNVVASDIAVLREVGGEAASYCPVGDVAVWAETILALLAERKDRPDDWQQRRQRAIAQAAKFSWAEHVRKLVEVYEEVLNSGQ